MLNHFDTRSDKNNQRSWSQEENVGISSRMIKSVSLRCLVLLIKSYDENEYGVGIGNVNVAWQVRTDAERD